MTDDHATPVRRTRTAGFDYRTRGTYFVTVRTHRSGPCLARLTGELSLATSAGAIVHEEWLRTPQIRADVSLDDYIVMPDHFHALFVLHPTRDEPRSSVSAVVRGLKAVATARINRARGTPGAPVWQRGYHFRLLTSPSAISRAREYIRRSPAEAARKGGLPAARRE